MREVDRLGWAATVPLRAGDHVLGVRASSDELAALLTDLFEERHVPGAEPPGNLSAYLAPAGAENAQDLHRVYETHRRLLRTRSVRETLEAVAGELDGYDLRAAGQRPLLDAAVVVREGRAHVLPPGWRPIIVDKQRQWAADGFELVGRRWLELDLHAARVTVPGPLLGDDALDKRVAALEVYEGPEGPRLAGSYPIASWALRGGSSLAQHVVIAGEQILDRQRFQAATLIQGLAETLTRVQVVSSSGAPRRLRAKLTAI